MEKPKQFIVVVLLILSNFQISNVLAQADIGKVPQPMFYRLTSQDKLNYTLTAGSAIKIKRDTFLYKFTPNDFRVKQQKQDCLIIPVKLTNNSSDTLKYIGMSCSWWDIYQTDNPQVSILEPNIECYKNGLTVLEIAPNHSVVVNIPVGYEDEQTKGNHFKIGMILEKYIENKQIVELNKFDTNNIIWSNEVTIP